jgi:hypothetical protein
MIGIASLRQNCGQSLHQEIEQDWQERVSLPHFSHVTEEMSYFSVNINHCLATLDQVHEPMDHHRGESLPKKYLLKKVPINPIICLLEVQLQEQTLLLAKVHLVDNLV